ncbi:peptidase S28 [Lophiotrema nucula]|uniref:Peptidase S28 n=1 Tax=Lophiotrema nucula TaxID=690887 RepID=A0A6A5YWC0_9PLEO|nr:peptidase S28 [Lophiotrema nucula]
MRSLSCYATALVTWLATASAVSTYEACNYSYLTQSIDHFDKHNGTFQQRYSVNMEFLKPGGPILLFQGEESDKLDCSNNTILYEWAHELGGMAVSLEHRYFGPSKPFGNASLSNDNFKFLTLDNVMRDAVELIDQLRCNISEAKESKVLVASGSYGGFLAGAFRLNHPETFDAALASAGPVMGFGGISDPESYNWYNWLNRLYQDHSIAASEKIRNTTAYLEQRLASNDTSLLQQELKLCTPVIPGNETQKVALTTILFNVFSIAAELNYPYASPGRTPIATPFFEILNFAVNTTDPMEFLNKVNWMWFKPQGAECIDHEHEVDFLNTFGVPLINSDVFSYITCTYCPMRSAIYSAPGTIFPTQSTTRTVQDGACLQAYNATTLSKSEIETRYHFSPAEVQNSTHIIWSKGEYDPTSAVEPLELPIRTDRHASRTLYAPDVAHREDLFRSNEKDRESTRYLRKLELNIIRGWLRSDE